MGRFHIPSAIILHINEEIDNKIIIEAIKYLSDNVNMDIFIPNKFFSKPNIKQIQNSNVIFFSNLHSTNVFIKKEYNNYVIVPLTNKTFVHCHLPQMLAFIKKEDKSIVNIKFSYLIYENRKPFKIEKEMICSVVYDKRK